MNPVLLIMRMKLRASMHGWASVKNESRLKVSVVMFSAVALWIAAYAIFFRGFRWLQNLSLDPTGYYMGIDDFIMERLLAVFSFSLFFLLIFSNILIVFSTLYRSREVNFLLLAPISTESFFLARFFECVLISSWALAYLGSPLILAYGQSSGAPWQFYLAAFVFYLPYVMLPAALGAMLTLGFAWLYPRLPKGSVVFFGAGLVLAFFLYLRGVIQQTHMEDDTLILTAIDAATKTQSPFLPSYWTSRGLLAAAQGHYGASLYNLGLLMANAMMATLIATKFAARIYYMGWSHLAGMERERVSFLGRGILGRLDKWLRILPEPVRSLTVKDIRLFWRDPTQWSQFVLFFGLMAIYIANLQHRSGSYGEEPYRSWIASLNVGACALILATLTSRFIFPLISLEGRRFWILGLAPLTFSRIVWQKFWLSVAATSVFTVGLIVLSSYVLQLRPMAFFMAVYSIIMTNFGLSGLAVGFGSLYPNFQEDNPARIVSGMGGTLNFLVSMGYIALVVAAQVVVFQWSAFDISRDQRSFMIVYVIALVFVTMVSLVCALIPMRLGLKNLQRSEY